MKCPKCEIKLEVMEREGHIGHCCSKCSGVLLTENFLSTLILKSEFSVESLMSSFESNVSGSSSCNCPVCNRQMKSTKYEETELDYCNYCKSVWFDFNELASTFTSHNSNRVGSFTPTKGEVASGSLEFICGILSNIHH